MVQLQQLGTFWTFALRCFFGELGDKTFFLTILLTAWVATWESARRGQAKRYHQLMVLAGALAGLLLHAILVSFDLVSARGSTVFNFLSVVLLVSIGIKLHFQVQNAKLAGHECGPTKQVETQDQVWNTTAGASWMNGRAQPPSSVQSNGTTEASTEQWAHFRAGAQDYGSTNDAEKDPCDHDIIKEPPQDEQITSFNTLIVAGLISMALIFVIEVGEVSQYYYLAQGVDKGVWLGSSSMLGYTIATCVAVFAGYVMESQILSDEKLLFIAEMAFFAMAVICTSQAVLGLNSLSMRQAAMALLSFTH